MAGWANAAEDQRPHRSSPQQSTASGVEATWTRQLAGPLPNFLIIGAMKAGTTSMYHYLRAHPSIFMSEEKEIHFFNRNANWERGPAWYAAHFAGAGNALAIGEASPGYTMYPHRPQTAERVAALLPEARLIYLVRHPIERMRSHYLHFLAEGKELPPIDQALVDDPLFMDMSRYSLQLSRYTPNFDESQILVLTSEALRLERDEVMRRVFTFLGVEPLPVTEREFHRTSAKRTRQPVGEFLVRVPGYETVRRLAPRSVRLWMNRKLTAPAADPAAAEISPSVRKDLESELRSDIRELRNFLGSDFDGWGIA